AGAVIDLAAAANHVGLFNKSQAIVRTVSAVSSTNVGPNARYSGRRISDFQYSRGPQGDQSVRAQGVGRGTIH
ncbi:MAG: hypothetical protein ABI854_04610, partial [Betaproteobacteria bacterium]